MRINILNGTRERIFKKKVMTSLKRLVDTKKISVKFNETKKRLYLKSIFIAYNENKRERIRLRTLELAKKDAARAKILEEKYKETQRQESMFYTPQEERYRFNWAKTIVSRCLKKKIWGE